ncbi:MAG: hypothetical protein ACE5EX_10835 [Phycisphaerae bacterium]
MTAHNKRTETYAWLIAKGRGGYPRIETLSWSRLAAIYDASRAHGPVRKAIHDEARRCGYTPRVILRLHGATTVDRRYRG